MTHQMRGKELYLHVALRLTALLGVLVLCVRRVIYIMYPAFLPSRAWHPTSWYAKLIGITINSGSELLALVALLGIPAFLYLEVRRRSELGRLAIDIGLSLLLYITAYFFLAPPQGGFG